MIDLKRGVIILKPDFFQYGNDIREYFEKMIIGNNLKLESFAEIEKYGDFCEKYRRYDIENSQYDEEKIKQELTRTFYATFVYKKEFEDKPALALTFSDENPEVLYEGLSNLKREVREYIKEHKKSDYYVDVKNEEWEVIKKL